MTDEENRRGSVAQVENKQEGVIIRDEDFHPQLAKVKIPRVCTSCFFSLLSLPASYFLLSFSFGFNS